MIYLHVYEVIENPKIFSKHILLENLSYYLGIKTSEIDIKRNKNGKPSVNGIHFSISHCKNKVVQVFTKQGIVGVDIEYINPKRKYLQLARRYFHKQEHEYLTSLESNLSLPMFYRLWTAKEAACKAQGGRLWYYLGDNFLSNKNTLVKHIKRLKLQNFNTIKDYNLTVATDKDLDNLIKFIYV